MHLLLLNSLDTNQIRLQLQHTARPSTMDSHNQACPLFKSE